MPPMPRKKGPPTPLRLDMPPPDAPPVPIALGDSSASAVSSATSESDASPFASRPRTSMNRKKLSLTLSSAQSSTNSLQLSSEQHPSGGQPSLQKLERQRRPSIISLPSANSGPSAALLHRKEEEGEAAVPYADGPIQIMPGIWLGSEENARDWKCLMERGIRSILNVAKEVASPFDSAARAHPLRSTVSSPDLHKTSHDTDSTYYPPHLPSGRPAMHYLKLQWSHGQQDLVKTGFPAAISFTDAALERGEGVLIHCQCGISRSATLVIALVMRAAAERSPSVPSEIWALKGMQGAYSFVKEKSKWVGPNMSLIYQLLDYERKLQGGGGSPSVSEKSISLTDEDEEWGRKRRLLDEAPDDVNEDDLQQNFLMQEAKALDKAMEDRIIARKSSSSSLASSEPAWKSRFAYRKRAPSVASSRTGSILSEDLLEEDEEQELLGVGSGCESDQTSSIADKESISDSVPVRIAKARPLRRPLSLLPSADNGAPPPSAPIYKTSFNLPPPPATAARATFGDIPSRPPRTSRRRPAPLGILPPVPSSPVQIVVDSPDEGSREKRKSPSMPSPTQVRSRKESRKLVPPPLSIRKSVLKTASKSQFDIASTPSQTLFVFPPSPTTARTPSTMTLTSNTGAVPFPTLPTPRVSTFRTTAGRTRSFIGLSVPPTPTTAFSKVDARGYVGLE